MSKRLSKTMLLKAMADAESGVEFPRQRGFAVCPCCEQRAYVTHTLPWDHGNRIRYHKCKNTKCLLCTLGTTIKSIETDNNGEAEAA